MKKKKTAGQLVEEKIKAKGITRQQVAKMVGINLATLSRILKDKQDYVSPETLQKIHTYLDALNSDDEKILK